MYYGTDSSLPHCLPLKSPAKAESDIAGAKPSYRACQRTYPPRLRLWSSSSFPARSCLSRLSPDCDLGVSSSGTSTSTSSRNVRRLQLSSYHQLPNHPTHFTPYTSPPEHCIPLPTQTQQLSSTLLHSGPPRLSKLPGHCWHSSFPQGHGPERGHAAPGLGRSRQVC